MAIDTDLVKLVPAWITAAGVIVRHSALAVTAFAHNTTTLRRTTFAVRTVGKELGVDCRKLQWSVTKDVNRHQYAPCSTQSMFRTTKRQGPIGKGSEYCSSSVTFTL